MTAEGRFRLPYRPSLDGLRGVAVLMVMVHHGTSFAPGGFLGVDVFFVLSGFLITALLMQEWERAGSISLRNFYARRALRLLPALLVLLTVLLVAPGLFGFGAVPRKLVLGVLFYVANWLLAFQLVEMGVFNPTWSLAIEEQFYFLWPPLLAVLLWLKVGRRWLLFLVLLGIASASVIRAVLWDLRGPDVAPRLYYGLDTRMDSLLLGCLIGLLTAWNLLPNAGWLLVATRWGAVLASILLGVLTYHAPEPTSESLFNGVELLACVAVAVLILALLTSPPTIVRSILEQPPLVWVGRISYGLYLWHVPIFHGVLNRERMTSIGITGDWLTILRFATAFAVAAGSFYLIERPMLHLKKRFRGSADAAQAAPLTAEGSMGRV
jgi:peptidoglycan/LPS O-acetylase OafA/YrhL